MVVPAVAFTKKGVLPSDLLFLIRVSSSEGIMRP